MQLCYYNAYKYNIILKLFKLKATHFLNSKSLLYLSFNCTVYTSCSLCNKLCGAVQWSSSQTGMIVGKYRNWPFGREPLNCAVQCSAVKCSAVQCSAVHYAVLKTPPTAVYYHVVDPAAPLKTPYINPVYHIYSLYTLCIHSLNSIPS